MIFQFVINLTYLLGALAFIIGLRMLSSPDTARKGNLLAGTGMILAIIAAIVMPLPGAANNFVWIFLGLIVGGTIGGIASYRVQMTAMPQMVSIFNGLGGACAVVLAASELVSVQNLGYNPNLAQSANVLFTLLIGGITFTGSMLAYAKLQDLLRDNKFVLPKHSIINIVMLLFTVALGVYVLVVGLNEAMFAAVIFLILSLLYGISFVVPIGGADMPVVISLLNSFSGISAALAGLIYDNRMMIVGGILVGASGTILTLLMCRAMNRSLLNVLVGGFGGGGATGGGGAAGDLVVKEASINDVAIQLLYSQSVIFVPGYGLAVAQAQKICKEVDDLLSANGVDVKYAIHPVAGRMPGHMNVLLAEADVPYPKLLDLEEANNALKNTDMMVIVGANDVVNPAAEDDPGSPIYGMPVLKVWDAKNIVVLKRSMRSGYAGIENPLFFHEKTRMLFGDAKDSLTKLSGEIKTL